MMVSHFLTIFLMYPHSWLSWFSSKSTHEQFSSYMGNFCVLLLSRYISISDVTQPYVIVVRLLSQLGLISLRISCSHFFHVFHLLSPAVDPTPDPLESNHSLISAVLVSMLPLLVMVIAFFGMFYWCRIHRQRRPNRQWESSFNFKRKPIAGGLDCSDACAIMTDDDKSDSSSTHANSLNHNTEPLPIELDLLVCKHIWYICGAVLLQTLILTFACVPGGKGSLCSGIQG